MASKLALSQQLSALSDAALEQVIREREVSPTGIKDFFDLAGILLKPESLDRCLTLLDRNGLAVIAVLCGSDTDFPLLTMQEIRDALAQANPNLILTVDWLNSILDRLQNRALLETKDGRFRVWPETTELLASWPERGLPSIGSTLNLMPPTMLDVIPDSSIESVDRRSAEVAFALIQVVGELIAELAVTPAPVRARGGLTLPAGKRIAETLGIDINNLSLLMDLAASAGLIIETANGWVALPASEAWLESSPADRWVNLVSSWYRRSAPDVVSALTSHPRHVWGETFRTLIPWLYPAAGEAALPWVEQIQEEARFIGIQSEDAGSSFAYALITSGKEAASSTLNPMLPAEVSQVYIQPDLTVISPGPLHSMIDRQLRLLAVVENRGLAATYRITEGSLLGALALGQDETEIRSFLGRISLTGIPQPLDYLIRETVRRYGSIRVESIPRNNSGSPARTVITADERHQLDTLLVDRGLQHLSLKRRNPDALVSSLSAPIVLMSLHEAKYPAALSARELSSVDTALTGPENEAARGQDPANVPAKLAKTTAKPTPAEQLRERLRTNQSARDNESPETGFIRQLSLAIKSKSEVTVSLVAPNGTAHEYTILPTSVSAQRLRGLDIVSDVERTLPVDWITKVQSAVR